jgi:hypothetical protein
MTAAQKLAKENFKKAIAYRKISGCTLKEAFAKIYNKKTAPIKKAASKVKKLVKKAKDAYYEGYNEAARKSNPLMVKKRKVGAVAKKKAVKKAAPKKVARKVVKKAAPKRSVSLHKDTKSHNVNIRVMSGYKKIGNLDEINKGDILVSHWGYDQTNVDFYTVIKKTGLGVTLAPMGEKIVEYNSNNMSGRVLPGEINYTAKTINRKIKKYSGGVYVSINTFATASKWNGQPQYFSNYA